MALNMNSFSDPFVNLRRSVNGPVLASVTVAFAACLASALLLTGPETNPAQTGAVAATDETCLSQTWPYREQKCRDAETAERKLRDVRIVSSDTSQPSRVVKSAVAEDAPAKATETPIQRAAPTPSGNQQFAASWLMGVERMPTHATVTPPIASLSLASANLPLPPVAAEPAQEPLPAPAAAPQNETIAPLQAGPSASAAVQQPKRIRTATTKPPSVRNNALTLVRT